MKYSIVFFLSTLTAAQCAQNAPQLELVVADMQESYGKGDQFLVDVYLHTTESTLASIFFCSLGDNIGFFDFKVNAELRPWASGGCMIQAPAGKAWLVLIDGRSFACPQRVVGITPGRVYLGSMKGGVVEDAEFGKASSIQAGDCSAGPSQAIFEEAGVPIDVVPAEPVRVVILRRPFIRGDANFDGIVDISDAIYILKILFQFGGDLH